MQLRANLLHADDVRHHLPGFALIQVADRDFPPDAKIDRLRWFIRDQDHQLRPGDLIHHALKHVASRDIREMQIIDHEQGGEFVAVGLQKLHQRIRLAEAFFDRLPEGAFGWRGTIRSGAVRRGFKRGLQLAADVAPDPGLGEINRIIDSRK